MVLLRTLCTVVYSGVQCGYHGWCSVASVTPGPELADITQCGERGGQVYTGQGRGVWGADHISHLTPVTHTPGPSDISDLADTRRTPGGGYKDPLLVLWSVTTELNDTLLWASSCKITRVWVVEQRMHSRWFADSPSFQIGQQSKI